MTNRLQIHHVLSSDFSKYVVFTPLVYWLIGMLGMSLGNATGYVSPIFPAAGFAVAMMLYSGSKAWPGIWLGSLLLNFWIAQSHGSFATADMIVAVGIATGSTLQAVYAYWLLKRHATACDQLETATDISRTLLFAGPLGCLVSASVGVSTIYAMGYISASTYFHSWWLWWTGDTLGVIIAMPIAVAVLYRREGSWRGRLRTVIVPTVITLGVVSVAFFATARWERQQQRLTMERYEQTVTQLLEERVIAHQEALSALKRLVEVTPDMTFQQFEYFTATTLRDNPDISALSFNAYVPLKQRARYELDFARRNGIPAFEITEMSSAKQLVRAADRKDYVSVSYIAPFAENRPAVGYDISSEPIRRQAIINSITSRQSAMTAPIHLVQESRERVGMLLLHPAYHQPAADDRSPSPEPLGFAVGVIKADEMIGIATRRAREAGLVFEVADFGTGQVIFRSSNEVRRTSNGSDVLTSKIDVADRSWMVSVWATDAYVQAHYPWTTWAVGVVGVVMASLLQILVLVITGHASIVERQVEDQTHELRLSGAALEDRNAQLSALFGLSPDGLVALNSQGIIKFVNPAFQTMTGISSAELVGMHAFEYLDHKLREQADNPASFSGIAACFANSGQDPQTLILRIPRHTVLQFVGVYSNAASAPRLIYTRDITREAEIDRMKSDFLSHAAHELRTPMSSIFGFSELLLEREFDRDTARDLLETIHQQTRCVVAIIDELLDLVRIESRQGMDFNIQGVDLLSLIEETLKGLSVDAQRWPIELLSCAERPVITADRVKLGLALANVLNNAKKYSPGGGKIEISIVSKKGMTGISVRDYGIGMSSEELKHFGERFWRADSSGNVPGTGLGTAIVMETMKILDGEVSVDSELGSGTTVTLWLHDSTPLTSEPSRSGC